MREFSLLLASYCIFRGADVYLVPTSSISSTRVYDPVLTPRTIG